VCVCVVIAYVGDGVKVVQGSTCDKLCLEDVMRCDLWRWLQPSCFDESSLVALCVLSNIMYGKGLNWDLCM